MRNMELDQRLVKIVPSPRQFQYQQLEFYAFVHFTVNTFTGKEWGDGTEDPSIFCPHKLDARQWTRALKAAGMKGLILTCKHHDGFCLWPSPYTKHSVASSPYRGGRGDVVREVADACRADGLKFGVYLSPWDRNNPLYGQGKAYDDYFCQQLTELLTQYGDVFAVWFDGACGEGPNGKKQYYDWERYYQVIRQLQPGACICVCGPDIRWCGNEAGDTRPSEWSVVPARTRDTEKIASLSQQADDDQFRQRKISASDRDLGSREALREENELIWYPAEVNTSIRPGWFYHKEEDDKVRSLEELLDIYYRSVGGNGTFLLNIPPTPEGLFHENDVARLEELGRALEEAFQTNLLDSASLSADREAEGYGIQNARTPDYDSYFKTDDGVTQCVIQGEWDHPQTFRYLVLQEDILLSQRVEAFQVEVRQEGTWKKVAQGTVIGYKKILPLAPVEGDGLRITIQDARVCPTLAFLGVY